MKLLTKAIEAKLRKNSELAALDPDFDPKPVVKFFNPTGAATWLLTELDEDGRLFGLADLGFGFPELGYSDLEELTEYKGFLGLGLERDLYWSADKTLSEYADEARAAGRLAA